MPAVKTGQVLAELEITERKDNRYICKQSSDVKID